MTNDPALLQLVSRGVGSAHAELAQLIWNGAIDDAQVVAMLRSDDDEIRRAVAWAVADAGRPPTSLSYLIEAGASDPLDAVRVRALSAAISYTGMTPAQIVEFLAPYILDPSPRVQHFARTMIERGGRVR